MASQYGRGTMCILYKWPQGAFGLFPDTAPLKPFNPTIVQNIRLPTFTLLHTLANAITTTPL